MYTTEDLDDAFAQLEQAAPTGLPSRAATTEPAFVDVLDDGLPVSVDAEVLHLGGPQHPTPRRPVRLLAAAAAVAVVVGSGAFVLGRHTSDRSSTSAARSSSATPRESIFNPGFDGQAGTGGSTAEPTPAPTLAYRTVPAGRLPVSPAARLPEAQAVGVKVGPLPAKYAHRSLAVVGSSSLPKTLVAGRTYTITFRYYAALGTKPSVGHVAAPFSDSRCPADFRIRPGHAYTVQCRVNPERGTDSIGFGVTGGPFNSSWEAGATLLLIAR